MLGIKECGSTNRMFSGPLILPGGQPRGSLTPGIRNRPMSLLLNFPTEIILQNLLYIRMIEMLSLAVILLRFLLSHCQSTSVPVQEFEDLRWLKDAFNHKYQVE